MFDREALVDMGCGLLRVNGGSAEPPRMVKLSYRPTKDGQVDATVPRLTFVGKGIMYDSGGISLKPADGTHATMKNDMSGAAAVLAAVAALGELGCTTAVTGYLMCTDNMPSGTGHTEDEVPAGEARGLRFALLGMLATIGVITLLTVLPDAPLRNPETGAIFNNSPLMESLIFIITLIFLVAGICYGVGAKTITSSVDVINAIVKTFSGLAGLVFLLLLISQFIAYFNFSNIPTVVAVQLADILEQWDIGALWLLIGFIVVIVILDLIIPGSLPKWAIFAPIFVPLFLRLGVAPQTVLAAYRLGDSPANVITPLMVYLPFIVIVAQRYKKDAGIGTIIALMIPYTIIVLAAYRLGDSPANVITPLMVYLPFIVIVAQRYKKDAGIGTIIALMIPYTIIVLAAWLIFFVVWYVIGIPLGPGYPVKL